MKFLRLHNNTMPLEKKLLLKLKDNITIPLRLFIFGSLKPTVNLIESKATLFLFLK